VTVQNFLHYVRSGHYMDTVFHYAEKGRLILGGGYAADGSTVAAGRSIRNEAHNGKKNRRGTLAMARDAGVIDSSTSQFFINLQDAPHLDHQGDTPDQYGYCVFGEVVSGLDLADQISAMPAPEQGTADADATRTVRIESVQVLR
jgi:cyclophilin family peptidyl-prolyl cis-trans isomerase